MEANFDDPTDFRLVQLQTLDENLRCPICKELFKTTMILSTCSHSFCALCIRRSLSSEACCPKCRKPAHESNLHNNYDLDNTVNTWRSSRELLLALDQQHSHAKSTPLSSPAIVTSVSNTEITNAQANDTNVFQSTPHRRSSRLEKKKSSLSPSVTTPVITAPPIEYVPSPTASAPASAQPTAPIQPTASTHSIPAKLTEESLVTCPICQQRMKMAVLNVHLDRCMQGDSRIPPDPKPSRASPSSLTHPSASSAPSVYFSSMSSSHSSPVSTPFAHSRTINLGKKPTKLVYDMQKEKDMRRILKDLGLPDHGDKHQMVWRHKEYVMLYNANRDSPHPVDIGTLIRQLNQAELAYVQLRQSGGKRSTPVIEEHSAKYTDDYARLIEEVRQRKKQRQQLQSKSDEAASAAASDIPNDAET